MMNNSIGLSRPAAPGRRWIFLGTWVLIALAYLAFLVIELRLDYRQLLLPCEGADCNWAALTEAEFAVLEEAGLPTRLYSDVLIGGIVITASIYLLLGVVIFWREGRTRIGFFMSLALIIMPIASYADADNVIANYPGLTIPAVFLSLFGVSVQFLLIYLFPNGRLYPRWAYIPLALTLVVVNANMAAFSGLINLGPFQKLASQFWLFFLAISFAVVFQVLRYFNDATPKERLQTRWVVFGGFFFYFLSPFLWFMLYGGEVVFDPGVERLLVSMGGWILLQVLQLTFLSTLAIAILRYRLWNIDLIIRRTLVYGSLTGTLAMLYFGTIVIFQGAFGRLTGEVNSPLVTVVSTLVIAALFNPLRQRLQKFIDQRFYRHKYNAEQSVAHFAESARDEVDMNRLAVALLATVDETIQPENTSLWINVPK